MLRDKVKKYFLDNNRNCAESMLLAANEEYGLDLGENEIELMRGFGGGMGSGITCGAVSGSIAALSKLICIKVEKERAHEVCKSFVTEFESRFSSSHCDVLTPIYKKEDVRCYELLLQTADLLDEIVEKYKV